MVFKILLKLVHTTNFTSVRKSDVESLLDEYSITMKEEREKGEAREGGRNKTKLMSLRD